MSITQNAAFRYLKLEVIEFEKFESKKFDCDKNPIHRGWSKQINGKWKVKYN